MERAMRTPKARKPSMTSTTRRDPRGRSRLPPRGHRLPAATGRLKVQSTSISARSLTPTNLKTHESEPSAKPNDTQSFGSPPLEETMKPNKNSVLALAADPRWVAEKGPREA